MPSPTQLGGGVLPGRRGGAALPPWLALPSSAAARPTSWPRRMRAARAGGHGRDGCVRGQRAPAGPQLRAVLAITRSGTTTEVIERPACAARAAASSDGDRRHEPGRPVTELADRAVLLPEVDEQSVVQTRFATSALALLRASLGEDLAAAIADARAVLAEDEAHGLAGLVDAEQVTFVGRGWTIGLADGGRPQAARVGPVLDRVLPRDGVPPRPDQHRHRGPRHLGLR